MSCSFVDRYPGLVFELLSVYMLLRISPKITDKRHSCLKVETLNAGEPGKVPL
jgi:hypothetical protein